MILTDNLSSINLLLKNTQASVSCFTYKVKVFFKESENQLRIKKRSLLSPLSTFNISKNVSSSQSLPVWSSYTLKYRRIIFCSFFKVLLSVCFFSPLLFLVLSFFLPFANQPFPLSGTRVANPVLLVHPPLPVRPRFVR